MGGSGRPPQRAKSARREPRFAPSRDAPISESRVGAPGFKKYSLVLGLSWG
jgi:hypothetical protein